jgi:hypothetical protein
MRQKPRWKLEALGLGAALMALVLGSFLVACWEPMRAMAQSVYPGHRRLLGGDFPDWRLFGGLYNYFTKNRAPAGSNESETSGFFLLFPALLLAAIASRRIRSRLDPVAWLLLGLALFLVYFSCAKLPNWFATVTLLCHVQAFRAQLALGLVSIILSIQLLATASRHSWRHRRTQRTALFTFVGCGALYLWEGSRFQANYQYFASASQRPLEVVLVSAGAALLCALMVLGLERVFSALLLPAVIFTSWTFNPLARGFPEPGESPLGRAMADVLRADSHPDGRPSLWLTFGGGHLPAIAGVAQVMGARTLAGLYQYPQLDLWRTLDPTGKDEAKYNRFASVLLHLAPAGVAPSFHQPFYTLLDVMVSPFDPALRSLGAKFVLTYDATPLKSPPYTLLYTSKQGFCIWELPPPGKEGG